jgi:recombination associated protein RdgC
MRSVWLKNLTVFRLSEFPAASVADIEEGFGKRLFNPCGAFDRESHGFAPAFGGHDLVRKTGDVYWAQIKSERKLLPGSVVRKALEERIADLEAQGRKVGRKYKRELKEQIGEELLAKAFAVESLLTVVIDPLEGWLVVDTSSARKAELVVSLLAACFSGLGLKAVEFDASTAGKMAGILLADVADPTFSVDGTLLLKSPQDAGHTARFANHDLGTPEIKALLLSGLTVAALELTWKARINFVLTSPFSVRRVKFLEVVREDADSESDENADELIDAQLLLQSGELRGLLADLMTWLEATADEAAEPGVARIARAA